MLKKENLGGDAMIEPKVLVVADESLRESLQSEIVPDPLDAEQTWPDEYDVKENAQRSFRLRCILAICWWNDLVAVKKVSEKRSVPKGTSSYQAAWIVDLEQDSIGGSEEESDEVTFF